MIVNVVTEGAEEPEEEGVGSVDEIRAPEADSAATRTETAVSGTVILKIDNPANVYASPDGT